MRYSNIIGKTKKEAPKDEISVSAQLLSRAGFVYKEVAGAYDFLPLGLRVLEKIIQVIREEMNAIGGQEVMMSALQNPATWEKSGRWNDDVMDVWFKTKLKNGNEVGLSPTHEEPLTALMKSQINSYKDLPLYPYQFQLKFRNELRAKGGLLRTREFIMEDLYSFCHDQKELEDFYENTKQAYVKIFNRLGIGDKTYVTFASGGSFSKYSHEFQTECENGEDTLYLHRGKNIAINKEVYNDEVLDNLGIKKDELETITAIEVGNIFKLGTKYSDSLDLKYIDSDGKEKPVVMGSYGIGPARVMATIVELLHDAKGIIWPENIAPFTVHLLGLNLEDEAIKAESEKVYETLLSKKIEALFDDRLDATAGQKFSDSDLIGIPYRAVVSKKTEDKIELKKRNSNQSELISLEQLIKYTA